MRNLDNFPVTLTSSIQHCHLTSISQMVSSSQWSRRSRMPTRRRTDPPTLRPERCSSYVTHPSQQTYRPQLRSSMDVQHKVLFFQDHPGRSIYARSARGLLSCKREQKEQFDRAHRARDLRPLKVKEQVQFFQNKPATGPIKWTTGTVTEVLECGRSYTIRGPNSRVYRRN